MKTQLLSCILLLLLFAITSSTSDAESPTDSASRQNNGSLYDTTVKPRSEDLFGIAKYRLWIPDNVKSLRGIIIRQHGCGPGARKFGLEHANDLQWQALARKHSCALLGTQLWAPQENCSTWFVPTNGSEYALLLALDRLAEESHHPELKTAPWCLWGHSGGAIWVMNMLYRHPERTIAVFPRSGGLTPAGEYNSVKKTEDPNSSPAALKVPVLFCYGEKENIPNTRFYGAVTSTHSVFDPARKKGALWAVAEHPDANHENRNSRLLAIRFFDGIMKARLATGSKLKPIDLDSGWLVNLKTKEMIKGSGSVNLKNSEWGWFPNEALANDWKELSLNGEIEDPTPPVAPSQVMIDKNDNGAMIKWIADADIQSGISEFRIYRDGSLIGTVKGNLSKGWNPKSHFHSWNYSDQPIFDTKKQPEMMFLDKSNKAANAQYDVSTVNRYGLESKKTKAAMK